jgi:hypothetical protein
MASGQGTSTLDFGAFPGSNETSIGVTGLTTISNTSKAEAYIMGDDSTTDHTSSDHRYANSLISLTCGTPTTGVGFTIYGTCLDSIEGTFQVRWVWAD